MRRENRKVLLLLDNAASHTQGDLELTNVTLEFLTPNTTSHLQPMDAGKIQNFKVHYKKMLTRHYIDTIDEGKELECLNLKQAIYFVRDAWKEVKLETIAHCFAHTNILPIPQHQSTLSSTTSQVSGQSDDVEELESLLQLYPNEHLTASEYLTLYDDLETGDHLSDEQIIQIVQPADGDGDDDDDDGNDDVPKLPPVSLSEAKKALESALRCFESHEGFGEEEIDSIRTLIKHVATVQKKNSVQTTLFSYFSKT